MLYWGFMRPVKGLVLSGLIPEALSWGGEGFCVQVLC